MARFPSLRTYPVDVSGIVYKVSLSIVISRFRACTRPRTSFTQYASSSGGSSVQGYRFLL